MRTRRRRGTAPARGLQQVCAATGRAKQNARGVLAQAAPATSAHDQVDEQVVDGRDVLLEAEVGDPRSHQSAAG
ncbi:MAG: hypothetical protein NVV66_00195 [Cellulomonas sp.]|uniref:hypothetical protein n=1 Tax=Cellulomonas sp. TaxID=40001 RepID=UPI00258C8FC1|nr:hypothetical protein [Cellulomonas sp.]MCR6703174.1 hypothetical protein [Cellulomonas sp.]